MDSPQVNVTSDSVPAESLGEAAWSALDTHHAAEAAGIRGLPASITWTALHKFAEEVSRAALSKQGA